MYNFRYALKIEIYVHKKKKKTTTALCIPNKEYLRFIKVI